MPRKHGGLDPPEVRVVWRLGLESAIKQIQDVVRKYPVITLDLKAPPFIATPLGLFKNTTAQTFHTAVANANVLKPLQLAMTFSDSNGNYPPDVCCWQFNFKFSYNKDMYSTDVFSRLPYIKFQDHEHEGIDHAEFADLLTSSGAVFVKEVTWVSMTSNLSFPFLMQQLMGVVIPPTEKDFFELLRIFFPNVYDIRYLMKSCKSLKGTLESDAMTLKVDRPSGQRSAGLDSLLASRVFFKMRELFFEGIIEQGKYNHMFLDLVSS